MTERTNSRAMHKGRAAFFEEGRRLDADPDPAVAATANCWICKQRIDYAAPPNSSSDSHHLDHYYPVSVRPDLQEDPTNWRHAHKSCNENRGNGAPSAGLGVVVPAWWN